MKALAPEAKLLVLLRDPVERYRSGVGQWQKHKERRGKRLNLWAGRKDAYARSFYGFALRPYVEAFGLDRIAHPAVREVPAGPRRRVPAHARVPGPARVGPATRGPGQGLQRLDQATLPAALDEPADLVETLEGDVRELLTFAPDIDLSLWPNFRHLAR